MHTAPKNSCHLSYFLWSPIPSTVGSYYSTWAVLRMALLLPWLLLDLTSLLSCFPWTLPPHLLTLSQGCRVHSCLISSPCTGSQHLAFRRPRVWGCRLAWEAGSSSLPCCLGQSCPNCSSASSPSYLMHVPPWGARRRGVTKLNHGEKVIELDLDTGLTG